MKTYYFLILFIVAALAVSCQSTPAEEQSVEEKSAEPQNVAVTEVESKPEEEVVTVIPVKSEYERSIGKLQGTVTEEEFNADKEAVMKVIADVAVAMKEKDYRAWLENLTPASIRYWSNQQNLHVLNIKLAGRGTTIRNITDYFVLFFIPSRQDATVDEIRYISESNITAVYIDGETELVYYTFDKIDGKWLISLDTNI